MAKKFWKADVLKGLKHFFTTRETIIKTKEPEFEEVVNDNKKKICDYLNVSMENLISPCQTHTNHVEIVKEDKGDYPETDGLILNNGTRRYSLILPIVLL